MEERLVVSALSKRFGDRQAAESISFSASPGVVTGLLGPNGAGKTTTMRMILDIIPPDSGSIEILGADNAATVRQRIGYLPEERGLYMKMHASEILSYFGQLRGMGSREAMDAALLWLKKLEISDRADVAVETLSKGLAQRVQFACALVHNPDLVILDEPMSGLDPIAADVIREIIVDLAHQDGKIVLLSTHDLDGAEKLCEELVLIDRGRVALTGELSDIKSRYGKSAVAIFFEGDASFLKTHPAVSQVQIYGGYADIELAINGDAQTLLVDCAGRIKINRFELVEPSLTEVFRRTIGRTSGTSSTERVVRI